jgi:hypothetical protein
VFLLKGRTRQNSGCTKGASRLEFAIEYSEPRVSILVSQGDARTHFVDVSGGVKVVCIQKCCAHR